jgi:peptidylprolyl isomerase
MADQEDRVKIGDTIEVHYTGKLDRGVPFDSSEGGVPLKFKVGEVKLIPGFEEAVLGMAPGETKVVNIPPEKAYGVYDENKVTTMNLADFPDDIVPEVGMPLQVCEPDGRVIPVQVTDIEKGVVTLDANHPLVDNMLIFEIKLLRIVDRSGSDGTEGAKK